MTQIALFPTLIEQGPSIRPICAIASRVVLKVFIILILPSCGHQRLDAVLIGAEVNTGSKIVIQIVPFGSAAIALGPAR